MQYHVEKGVLTRAGGRVGPSSGRGDGGRWDRGGGGRFIFIRADDDDILLAGRRPLLLFPGSSLLGPLSRRTQRSKVRLGLGVVCCGVHGGRTSGPLPWADLADDVDDLG